MAVNRQSNSEVNSLALEDIGRQSNSVPVRMTAKKLAVIMRVGLMGARFLTAYIEKTSFLPLQIFST